MSTCKVFYRVMIKLIAEIKQGVGLLHTHYSVQAGLSELFFQAWYVFYLAKPHPPDVVGEMCFA